MKNSKNYNTTEKRIMNASSMLALLRVKKSINSPCDHLFLTVEERRRLDDLIFNRLEKVMEAKDEND